jgi:hypothetical protein
MTKSQIGNQSVGKVMGLPGGAAAPSCGVTAIVIRSTA